jgi:HAMP domain-containing protein
LKLLVKFNLAFIALFVVVIAATGSISWNMLQRNAKQEVYESAKLLIDNALAVRSYTNERVAPLLDTQLKYQFMPEVVAAFSALQVIDRLKQQNPEYKDFQYREPTLNPTNPRDRPADWERDLIGMFRSGASQPPLFGERDTPVGRVLYMSKPLKAGATCLRCHSTPEAAPPTMIHTYGPSNGFGWVQNEIIGAQVVEVPVSLPLARAWQAFLAFMTSLTLTLVGAGLLLNLMIWLIVVRPVTQLSQLADRISMGDLDAPDFALSGRDEIRTLADSLSRMRKSVVQAMKMLRE